jgi:hypothetical protein
MRNNSQSDRDDQPTRVGNRVPLRAPVRSHREWAENWFAGSAYCPVCGSDELGIRRTRADDVTRIEEWQCCSKVCAARWQVELRESAVGIYVDDDGLDVDWYERTEKLPKSHISVEDGREAATILAALSYWRRDGLVSAGREQNFATDHERIQPLSGEEIDALCERIKRGDIRSPLG